MMRKFGIDKSRKNYFENDSSRGFQTRNRKRFNSMEYDKNFKEKSELEATIANFKKKSESKSRVPSYRRQKKDSLRGKKDSLRGKNTQKKKSKKYFSLIKNKFSKTYDPSQFQSDFADSNENNQSINDSQDLFNRIKTKIESKIITPKETLGVKGININLINLEIEKTIKEALKNTGKVKEMDGGLEENLYFYSSQENCEIEKIEEKSKQNNVDILIKNHAEIGNDRKNEGEAKDIITQLPVAYQGKKQSIKVDLDSKEIIWDSDSTSLVTRNNTKNNRCKKQ